MMVRPTLLARVAAVAVLAVVPAGCGLSLQQMPKPGGLEESTYPVTARFTDVLNLPANAQVREGARVVGEVGSMTLDGADIYAARVDVIALRKRMGMVFQKPNPFPMSIFENIIYPLRVDGVHLWPIVRLNIGRVFKASDPIADAGYGERAQDHAAPPAAASDFPGNKQERSALKVRHRESVLRGAGDLAALAQAQWRAADALPW